MDKVELIGMRLESGVGVAPIEAHLKREFEIDLVVHYDLQASSQSDDVEDTVNYGALYQMVRELTRETEGKLIERLARLIAGRVHAQYPQHGGIEVRILKVNPFVGGRAGRAGVHMFFAPEDL